MVTVAAAEARLAHRQLHQARCSVNIFICGRITIAGHGPSRINCDLEVVRLAIQERVHSALGSCLQKGLHRILISAEGAVVFDVEILAAKVEIVVAFLPVHILNNLEEVLRPAKWNCATGRRWQIAREINVLPGDCRRARAVGVERGAYRSSTQRLRIVQPAEQTFVVLTVEGPQTWVREPRPLLSKLVWP